MYFSGLNTDLNTAGMDNAFLNGTRAIGILVKQAEQLVGLHICRARQRDNFAAELVSVYKTAIALPLIVDAPPCRTRRATAHLADRPRLRRPTSIPLISHTSPTPPYIHPSHLPPPLYLQ